MNYRNFALSNLVAVLFALTILSVAKAAEPLNEVLSATTNSSPALTKQLADRVGLGKEFEDLRLAKEKGDDARELLWECRVLRRLWVAQFEINRIVARIDEERTVVNEAVSTIENKQQRISGIINSVNFLSTAIIDTVGNAIFIPAPPPRPAVPNTLFTLAGGIETSLSILGLVATHGGKTKLSMRSESVLSPLFVQHFKPSYSQLLWHYIAYKNAGLSPSPREQMIAKWVSTKIIPSPETENGKMKLLEMFGNGRHPGIVTLHDLKLRQKMLSDLEACILQLSNDLAGLARSI